MGTFILIKFLRMFASNLKHDFALYFKGTGWKETNHLIIMYISTKLAAGLQTLKSCIKSFFFAFLYSFSILEPPIANFHQVSHPAVKFIYSEKATKFCEISTILLSYVVPVKSNVEISQNFEAFSEYMNFNKKYIKKAEF